MLRFAATRAQLDLVTYRQNLSRLRELASPSRLLVVVKANAYGHGVEVLCRVLREMPDLWLGVATLDEGIELRELGVKNPILMMGFYCLPGVAATVLEYRLTPAIFNLEMAERTQQAASRMGVRIAVHIKVDTGMARLGARGEEVERLCLYLAEQCPNLKVEGIFSHLADTTDPDLYELQRRRFEEACRVAEELLGPGLIRHLHSSAGLLLYPEHRYEMVRVGILSLGYPPPGAGEVPEGVSPVLTLKSQIMDLRRLGPSEGVSYHHRYRADREVLIATVPMGYADGYSTLLSGCGYALVRGRRVPVVGQVTMDYLMLDVSEVSGVKVEDEVVLVGAQGEEAVWFDQLAELSGLSIYELMSSLGRRIKREPTVEELTRDLIAGF